MSVKLLTEHRLEFLSLTGGCTGSSESTLVKMPYCWKSHVTAHISFSVSAFYAEHYNKRISLDGYIWTKSKFLGLSIGVHMIGQAVISVLDHDEEYIITFPNGYGR